LEETILSVYKSFDVAKHRRPEEGTAIISKHKKNVKKQEKNVPIRLLHLRFADEILIIGKNHTSTLLKVKSVLKNELRPKGLKIKNKDKFGF